MNAQEITIDLSASLPPGSGATTGDGFDTFFNESNARFFATTNPDGITTSNELIAPVTNPVPEAGDAGLELTLVNATATTGVDNLGGDNRASFSVTGLGMAIVSTRQRVDPNVSATAGAGAGVVQSSFRLDATHEEFLTFSFNQNVTVSAIVVTSLDPGETFQFGPATSITDFSDLTLDDLTPGTISTLGVAPSELTVFTFATPLAIPAGEEILVGQTGFDPDTLASINTGVGMERIILTLDGGAAPLIGDVNMDGAVNFLDISPFIGFLASGEFKTEADVNGDGSVNFLDISPFIAALSGA